MLKRFDSPEGRFVKKIYGQDRFGFAMSDTNDLYDLVGWAERGGYQGSVILFYDFEKGVVYKPFEKKRNVVYGDPDFAGGYIYFLRADYDEKTVTLYRCVPGGLLEPVTALSTEDADLYNLRVVGGIAGDQVYIISQKDKFVCHYPERFSFHAEPNETAAFIEDGRVYFEAWVEEGWDAVNDRATDSYSFYNKVVVKDFEGNTVSEEIGSLYQSADGSWWIT